MFFVSLLALAGGVSCVDDISDVVAPALTVSTEQIAVPREGGTYVVDLSANCVWSVSESSLNMSSWLTITPQSGKGDTRITITVPETDSPAKREATISFEMTHPDYGRWGKAEQMIHIVQYPGDFDPDFEAKAIYQNDFDKAPATQSFGSNNSSWPFLDQSDCWKNEQGDGAANVTYDFSGISARNNSNSNGSYSDYDGSGVNNLFFAANNYFTIEKIDVSESNKLELTFGTEKYLQSGDSTFNPAEFAVTLSADGTQWSAPIEYSFANGYKSGRWDLATADFELPEGTQTLYIKFVASVASAYRLDDVKLTTGLGGQKIEFSNSGEGGNGGNDTPSGATATIADILKLSTNSKISDGTVIEGVVVSSLTLNNLTSQKTAYVQDATGGMQFYFGSNHDYAFGTRVRIDLSGETLGEYSGAPQISGTALTKVTVLGTDEKVEAKAITADELFSDAYYGQYVAIADVQVVAADLSKTWASSASHTSINIETKDGKSFVVFSSKYSTYNSKVPQGSGTLKGIASVNNGTYQLIFATNTDGEGLTGERFTTGGGSTDPDPTPSGKSVTIDNFSSLGTSYGDFSITAADGSVWMGFAMKNSDNLQLGWNTTPTQNAAKSYIKTPASESYASTVTITPASNTTNNRWFVALPVDFEYTGQSVDEVKALAYAVSAATVAGSTDPLTLDLTGKNVKQFVIRSVGGASYVQQITVNYGEGGGSTDPGTGGKAAYKKATSVTSGKKYLIVGAYNGSYYALDGTAVKTGNGGAVEAGDKAVTVTSDAIESNSTVDAYAVTLTGSASSFTLQATNGNFVEYAGSGTSLKAVTSAGSAWKITWKENGTAELADTKTPTRILCYRNGSSYNRFAGYLSANVDNKEYFYVTLYEYTE